MTESIGANALQARHLEEWEQNVAAAVEAADDEYFARALTPEQTTTAEAVDRIRRIRYHREHIARIHAEAEALIAPLQAEIERIKAWAEQQLAWPERAIRFHEAWLRAYYMANPPAKGKTLQLPGGTLEARAQQPEWTYDEAAVLAWAMQSAPQFVRVKRELAKADLKKAVTVRPDGTVATPDGEVVPGVTVTERPDTFTVKVEV